ncbi:hypothetical protein ACWEQC_44195 [Streptomyces shenzhenensis]
MGTEGGVVVVLPRREAPSCPAGEDRKGRGAAGRAVRPPPLRPSALPSSSPFAAAHQLCPTAHGPRGHAAPAVRTRGAVVEAYDPAGGERRWRYARRPLVS